MSLRSWRGGPEHSRRLFAPDAPYERQRDSVIPPRTDLSIGAASLGGSNMVHTFDVTDADRTFDDLIESVPWSRLAHAYDVALDAPMRLRALAADVEQGTSESFEDVDDWLLWSVVHQGTPYSATAPVLWIARRILGDGSTHPALASCLLAVAEAATALRWIADQESDEPGDGSGPDRAEPDQLPWATYLPLGRELAQKLGDRVHDDYFLAAQADVVTLTACVVDWEQTVVDCMRDQRFLDEAISAGSAMVRRAPSSILIDALRSLVSSPLDLGQRAASAFALAASGSPAVSIDALVAHDDRAIRVAAALGCPDHPHALDVLIGAVADRPWIRTTFPRGLIGPEPWLASALLDAVLDRVSPDAADDRLVDALEEQLATVAYGALGATYEWGRVLAWLFPDRWQPSSFRDVPSSDSLSNTQRRLLAALERNNDPWDQGAGNASLVLGQVGLPHDRSVLATLTGAQIPGRRPWWRRPRS